MWWHGDTSKNKTVPSWRCVPQGGSHGRHPPVSLQFLNQSLRMSHLVFKPFKLCFPCVPLLEETDSCKLGWCLSKDVEVNDTTSCEEFTRQKCLHRFVLRLKPVWIVEKNPMRLGNSNITEVSMGHDTLKFLFSPQYEIKTQTEINIPWSITKTLTEIIWFSWLSAGYSAPSSFKFLMNVSLWLAGDDIYHEIGVKEATTFKPFLPNNQHPNYSTGALASLDWGNFWHCNTNVCLLGEKFSGTFINWIPFLKADMQQLS